MARVFPRAAQHSRRPPRVWPYSENSIETWLEDRIWILNREQTGSGIDGQPSTIIEDIGPFAGKVGAPVNAETFQPDRNVIQGQFSLALASDFRPVEADRLRIMPKDPRTVAVRAPDGTLKVEFEARIEGTVNPRPSAWGAHPLWNMEIVVVSEH